jgi:NTE family protein
MVGKNKISVSLVLGSGGARGFAHIGAIHWLEENGYEIRSISGCSIGALIGGIYACGKLDLCEQWVRAISRADIFRLLNVLLSERGLVEDDIALSALKELVGDRQIEGLPIAFTAVAADINREKEIWIRRGSLFNAIRASISLPLFFTPFEMNGIKLLDGGVLDPVPIAPTLQDNNDLTIAINLVAPASGYSTPALKNGIRSSIDSLHENRSGNIDELKNGTPLEEAGIWKARDMANQAFDAMQGEIARQKLAADPPDYTIMIARDACGMLEFDRADELIELGYETAAQSLGRSGEEATQAR